jgi:hypothetical protein
VTGWIPPGAGPGSPYPGGADPGPGFPPPAYPIAGYPGQPYAPAPHPGYPPGHPGGYPVVPYPQGYAWAPVEPQPGTILGASILAYINSGLLILSGSLLLFGAAVIHDIDKATRSHTGYGTELAVDGVLNLIAGGLLIAGGVALTNRRTSGRVMLTAGAAVVLAECIYWLTRFSNSDFSGRIVYVLLFGALAVISVALSWTPAVTAWLERGRPQPI